MRNEEMQRRHFQFVCFLLTNCFIRQSITIPDDYTGHQLFRVLPRNNEQLEVLQKLRYHPPAKLENLDFWSEPTDTGGKVYMGVSPGQQKDLEDLLSEHRIPFEIMANNIQRVLDDHAQRNLETRLNDEVSIYDTYLDFDEAMSWLRRAALQCGSRCSLHNIGKSFEGRNLTLIKVQSAKEPSSTETGRKPSIWIDSGIHAREWIAPATALYFIDRLVLDYDIDLEVQDLVDGYDWYILPFVNPDGYQYSHVKNRLWRKTRSKVTPHAVCVGVDANRNFDFHWKSVGFQDDPCSDIYPGPLPFSEPETKAVADFLLSRNGTWTLFVTLHSYGQLLMTPFGYTTDKPEGYAKMMKLAKIAKLSIENVYQTEYTVGSASDILYRSSGTSRDWAYGVAKIPYVYTIELRDQGEHGFLLPPNQILSSGIETWEGVKNLALTMDQLEHPKTPWNL